MIVQNISGRGEQARRHLVHAAQERRPGRAGRAGEGQAHRRLHRRPLRPALGKVSLVGAGMRSHPGVSATFFDALADAGVNLELICTSEIRISVVCRDADVDIAVRAVHHAFDLGTDEARPSSTEGPDDEHVQQRAACGSASSAPPARSAP